MAAAPCSAPLHTLLIGFQDQDNLGLRYLVAAVRQAGLTADIITYQSDPAPLIRQVQEQRPAVIGFSLIFQYMAPDFARVITAMRDHGITAHITMGGHYPSFDYAEVLTRIRGLDSIVRYEGEATLVELLQTIREGADWRTIPGIAYRHGDTIVANPLRPAIADLDTLPWPYREDIAYAQDPLPTASILGSRGCPWDCSFCSIRPFYEAQGGRLRRLRKPEAIVAEMKHLYDTRGVTIFLFQDDDFTAGGKHALQWGEAIASGIIRAGLAGKIAFKISCRADEVHEANMRKLVAGGLCHVYMGVEAGDEQGLRHLNKRLGPSQHFEAGRILRALDLSFDFGFMLLEPYSTFAIVRNNVDFLEQFVGDGWSVASFCRMLPYAGTPVKQQLESEARLLGTPFEPDYHFLDPKLDVFYDWMLETFYERNFTNRGFCHILKSLAFEAHLSLPGYQVFDAFERRYLQHITALCNSVACFTLRTALSYLQETPLAEVQRDRSFLQVLTHYEREEERRIFEKIVDLNWRVRRKQHSDSDASLPYQPLGGFDKSWTIAEPAPMVER
jgi:anaerobic magnesium-protoporphyrin IX monomethyl ester cyclase